MKDGVDGAIRVCLCERLFDCMDADGDNQDFGVVEYLCNG